MEAGCSRQTISNLENNQVSRPSIPEVAPVCLALGITLDWYWLGIGAPPDLSDQIKKAVDDILRLNGRP
jgi:transcriptional regulator with XRE-family HTH domain